MYIDEFLISFGVSFFVLALLFLFFVSRNPFEILRCFGQIILKQSSTVCLCVCVCVFARACVCVCVCVTSVSP